MAEGAFLGNLGPVPPWSIGRKFFSINKKNPVNVRERGMRVAPPSRMHQSHFVSRASMGTGGRRKRAFDVAVIGDGVLALAAAGVIAKTGKKV
jgi:hypothetical protein